MSEDDRWRAELSAKMDHVSAVLDRLEKRVEKDADELYERVRKLEIDQALHSQALEHSAAQAKKNNAFIAAAVGALVSGLVAAAAHLLG